jgi:hypothetical protein
MKKLNFNKMKTLNFSGMPQMNTTLFGWEQALELVKVVQSVIEGDLSTQYINVQFKGVVQPLRDEQLSLLPEGQRSWEWIWIHAVAGSLNLETADKVIFQNKTYKVTSKKDYSLNGYVEYQLVRDYTESEYNG